MAPAEPARLLPSTETPFCLAVHTICMRFAHIHYVTLPRRCRGLFFWYPCVAVLTIHLISAGIVTPLPHCLLYNVDNSLHLIQRQTINGPEVTFFVGTTRNIRCEINGAKNYFLSNARVFLQTQIRA